MSGCAELPVQPDMTSSGANFAFVRLSTKKQPSSRPAHMVPSRCILLQNMSIQELHPKGLTVYASACPLPMCSSILSMALPTCATWRSRWKSNERREESCRSLPTPSCLRIFPPTLVVSVCPVSPDTLNLRALHCPIRCNETTWIC